MKKLVVAMALLPAVFWSSCSKDDDSTKKVDHLISPEFEIASLISQDPFTGILLVSAAEGHGSVYYGNYNVDGMLTPLNAAYTIQDGEIQKEPAPVRLPEGDYTFVYWGVPKTPSSDSIYADIAISEPALTVGKDMKDMYYQLRKYNNPDTTYYPVYDYAYAMQNVNVGTDKMSALLKRVCAGLKVTLTDKTGGPINENIESIKILIGDIASSLNYYTAEASDFSKTISFPLTKSADGMEMSANSTVMLFPSAPNPMLTFVIQMKNGSEKVHSHQLTNTLSAGTRLTLTAAIGNLVEESGGNGFEVTNWVENSEHIDISN